MKKNNHILGIFVSVVLIVFSVKDLDGQAVVIEDSGSNKKVVLHVHYDPVTGMPTYGNLCDPGTQNCIERHN